MPLTIDCGAVVRVSFRGKWLQARVLAVNLRHARVGDGLSINLMTHLKDSNLKTYFLILVMIIAGPLGNVLLGKGMKQAGELSLWPPSHLLYTGLTVFTSGTIWVGIASLLCFFVAYMLALSWADYSYVQPASSLAYAVVALLGYWLLGERVSPLRWIGIALISLGVFVVGRTNPRTAENA
jgi:drug/metabolite transporter (DMT)-like permease